VIPDLTDEARLAKIGRMTVLRKARRETAMKIRDLIVPMLNSMENGGMAWQIDGLIGLVEELNQLNKLISEQPK
jgi:hypothetical protein